MTTQVTMTDNWQIHLPKKFRQSLGLSSSTVFTAVLQDDIITLKPQKSQLFSASKATRAQAKKQKIKIDKVRDLIDYSKW